MPFTSLKQSRWARTPAGLKALGGPEKVKEWSDATDFNDLPEMKTPKRKGLGGAVTIAPKVNHGG